MTMSVSLCWWSDNGGHTDTERGEEKLASVSTRDSENLSQNFSFSL